MKPVAVGLPVYNGERYLSGALDSLLAQDYPNFSITISDNASTDRTEDICRQYARQDSRINYSRNKENIGGAQNFNKVFHVTQGEYFMWAAHDDLWSSNYISSCVHTLQSDSSLVACASEVEFIDCDGKSVEMVYNKMDTAGLTCRARVRRVTEDIGWFAIYAVMRRKALSRTQLCPNLFGGDVILLMDLAFYGGVKILPHKLFRYRYLEKSSDQYLSDITGEKISMEAPYINLLRSLVCVINRSRMLPWTKSRMREDLISNVFAADSRWVSLVAQTGLDSYHTKCLIDPGYWELDRFLDHHIRWRLKRVLGS